jgi:hypothetical protein
MNLVTVWFPRALSVAIGEVATSGSTCRPTRTWRTAETAERRIASWQDLVPSVMDSYPTQ